MLVHVCTEKLAEASACQHGMQQYLCAQWVSRHVHCFSAVHMWHHHKLHMLCCLLPATIAAGRPVLVTCPAWKRTIAALVMNLESLGPQNMQNVCTRPSATLACFVSICT